MTPVFIYSIMSTNDPYKYHRISVALPLERKEALNTNMEAAGLKGPTDLFHIVSFLTHEEALQLKTIADTARTRISQARTSNADLKELMKSLSPEELRRFVELAKSQ